MQSLSLPYKHRLRLGQLGAEMYQFIPKTQVIALLDVTAKHPRAKEK